MAYYKVLLADDEKEIRQGIIQKIDWEANGFILAGDASNGREALELAEKIHPDVVMTDIKMPFMSGLELGEILAVEMPLTKLVLFSGFDDFEYAKQAIKINASEYILKPVDSKEVTILLQKLKKQLDHEMKERRDVEILRQNYIQSLPLLRQQFFSSLMEGNFSEKRIQTLMKQYQINLKANCWTVTVIRGDIKENGGKYIATYGQTEGSARMAYLPDEYAISKYGSIGKAIPNGKLYLVDDRGGLIDKTYTQGEMVYEGPNVTLGYAECRGDLLKGDENYGKLYTGDIAYVDEDGMFYIVGRKKRFLKLFGYRVSLDECEQLIKSKYAIECACAGNDEKLCIYITDNYYEKLVKDYILDQTELYADTVEVKVLSSIPKSDAGKVLYSQL